MVQNAFSGHIKELLIKIEKMEAKYKIDIMESEMKILKVEHDNIILRKEIETNNRIYQLEKTV